MDAVMLNSGRIIPYTYDLTYDGIIATAHVLKEKPITTEEKHEFKSKLQSERDLVALYWNTNV